MGLLEVHNLPRVTKREDDTMGLLGFDKNMFLRAERVWVDWVRGVSIIVVVARRMTPRKALCIRRPLADYM